MLYKSALAYDLSIMFMGIPGTILLMEVLELNLIGEWLYYDGSIEQTPLGSWLYYGARALESWW